MNSKQQLLRDRFYKFALGVIGLVRKLPHETAGIELGKQLIRSGTSIAANYEEAISGFSKADFIHKISISFKEAKESNLWLRLLWDSKLAQGHDRTLWLIEESDEISNILGKSLKTSREIQRKKA